MRKSFNLPPFLGYLFLAGIGFLIYSNTFHSPLLFDDQTVISGNPSIKNLTDLTAIWNAFNTRFFVGLSLALNYKYGGLNVSGYHFFNILVHILCAFQVFTLLRWTLRLDIFKHSPVASHAKLVAFLTALLFLIHPVQTQAVTYIWQRAASMATLFYLTSLIWYVQFRLTGKKIFYFMSLIAAIVSMFCKEIAMTLPFAVILYEIFFISRSALWKKRSMLLLMPFLLTLLIIPATLTRAESLTLDLMRPSISNSGSQVPFENLTRFASAESMPRHTYLLTQINVLRTYLRLLALPIHQNLDYDYPLARASDWPNLLFSLLVLGAVFFLAMRNFKKNRFISFGIAWFFLTCSVEAVVPQNDVIFEHRLYLPMLGFSIAVTSFMFYYFRARRLKILLTFVMAIYLIFSVMTYHRNSLWTDPVLLWTDTIHKSPNKARPYNNRANAYARIRKFDAAISDFSKVLDINPFYLAAYTGRGDAYLAKGDFEFAFNDFEAAIKINPVSAKSYTSRGSLYHMLGRFEDAKNDFSKAISLKPDYADAYNNRGVVNAALKKVDEAMEDLKKALVLNPDLEDALNNLGMLLKSSGKNREAIEYFNKSIQLNPKSFQAYHNRGTVNKSLGYFALALEDYNSAIKLNPNMPLAYNNRANVHILRNNLQQALADYDEAIRLRPDFAEAYYNRAGLLASYGSYYQSLEDLDKAIVLNPSLKEAYLKRATVNFFLKRYEKSLKDATKAKELGAQINPELISAVKKELSRQ